MASRIIDRHFGTYQGFPIQAISYKRGEGLSPEPGWVDLQIKDVQKLDVDWKNVPWRGVNGAEMPGQIPFHAWLAIRGSVGASGPGDPPSKRDSGGLNLFGQLVLTSTLRDGEEVTPPMTYHDVYVAPSGLEEVTSNLARIKRHDEGNIRVPITDAREFYKNFGGLVCRINVRSKSGYLEPDSMKPGADGTFVAVSAREGVAYVMSQLPGSPVAVPTSDLVTNAGEFDGPCPEIVGEGEPAAEHLQRLLDQLGLVAKYLPTGNYEINRRGTTLPGYGSIMVDGGNGTPIEKPITDYQRYERKSVTFSMRPPFVQVFGKRVVRRITLSYIPVIQDEDGVFFRLEDIETLWGYTLKELNKQVMSASATPFFDVPGKDQEQKAKRIALLMKWAYRGYLPATAFARDRGIGGAIPGVTAAELEKQSFLPFVNFAAYPHELALLGVGSTPDESDATGYVLVPPAARGQRIGQGSFKDFEAVRTYFNQLKQSDDIRLEGLRSIMSKLSAASASAADVAQRAENDYKRKILVEQLEQSLDKKIQGKKIVLRALGGAFELEYNQRADVDLSKAEFSKTDVEFERLMKIIDEAFPGADGRVEDYNAIIKKFSEDLDSVQKKVTTWEEEFKKLEDIYLNLGALRFARMNLPFGSLGGSAHIDPKTGLLISASGEPLCHTDKPFLRHGDSGIVVSDGAVQVTAGYEVRDSGPGGLTSALFSIDPNADPNEPAAVLHVGFNRASPLKAYVMRMPSVRMYQLDGGAAVNGNEVRAAGEAKARGILSQPPKVTGYTYVLSGFHNAVCAGNVTSVSHHFEPAVSALATTTVIVGNPGGRTFEGGLGAVFPPNRPGSTAKVQIREMMETLNGPLD